MLAPSVYLMGHVCSYVQTVVCLVLELVQSLWERWWVWMKLEDHTLDVGIICKCVLSAQLPVLFRKVRTLSISVNNIHAMFPNGTWPDTTELLGVRHVVKTRGACTYEEQCKGVQHHLRGIQGSRESWHPGVSVYLWYVVWDK
jgi:hypothetical protein